MRLSPAATVGMLLGLALVLPACGEERTATADRTASTASTTPAEATTVKAAPARGVCHSQLRGFLAAMDVLRSKLARGLSYDDYLHEVREVRAIYDGIEAQRLAIGCLVASGGPGERAFNLYIDAANAWGDCLATVPCSTASVEPKLQHKWALASDRLTASQRGLRSLGRG